MFELSAFIHSHQGDTEPRLTICPVLLGPALLGLHFALGAFVCLLTPFRPSWPFDYRLIVAALNLPCFVIAAHAVRNFFRSIDKMQQQVSKFSIEESTSSCCENAHPDGIGCDRKIILRCISAWFGSVQNFELCVQTDVRRILVQQLSNQAFAYSRIVQSTAPIFYLFLDRALRYEDERVQIPTLLEAFTYWLGVVPTLIKIMCHLCYYLRFRLQCGPDILLSLVVTGLNYDPSLR